MNIIARTISETRKAKGITQEELAEIAKVNVRTIQRIENNESEPRGKTLNLICTALQIDGSKVIGRKTEKMLDIATKIANAFFLIALNLVLMLIIGYMTLDSKANLNSRFGGVLVSIFLPIFIVLLTRKMSGMERMLKFGIGYIVYFILVTLSPGFPTGFVTGLFPCLLLSISVLYFGQTLIKDLIQPTE